MENMHENNNPYKNCFLSTVNLSLGLHEDTTAYMKTINIQTPGKKSKYIFNIL